MKTTDADLVSPCGLYCGVCAIHIAHRDNNQKLKQRLVGLYKGGVDGKGSLPTQAKGYTGCHQCDDFPCPHIEAFPMTIGKKVILRAVPYRRNVGTEKWVRDEKARYVCPDCGNTVFRGAARCNRCKAALDLD